MLLGREEYDGEESNSEGESGSMAHVSAVSKTSSQIARQVKEQDDDSPYFVKITLDTRFLKYLDEPSIVEPSEIHL